MVLPLLVTQHSPILAKSYERVKLTAPGLVTFDAGQLLGVVPGRATPYGVSKIMQGCNKSEGY